MLSNNQIAFWRGAQDYTKTNDGFDFTTLTSAWREMLAVCNPVTITSALELGANIGRNIQALNVEIPTANLFACDVNGLALETLRARVPSAKTFHSSILDLPSDNTFDLVFTSGVLIHIHPDDLTDNLQKVYRLSNRFIILIEYFSQNLETVRYRNRDDLLWKRDFGALFMENFDVEPLRQGFLWSKTFGQAGFDDCTYWVFRKN